MWMLSQLAIAPLDEDFLYIQTQTENNSFRLLSQGNVYTCLSADKHVCQTISTKFWVYWPIITKFDIGLKA